MSRMYGGASPLATDASMPINGTNPLDGTTFCLRGLFSPLRADSSRFIAVPTFGITWE